MDQAFQAQAGTLESCDALVTVIRSSADSGVAVAVESSVAGRFTDEIRRQVLAVADTLSVTDIAVRVIDRGALNFVLQARVETALRRLLDAEQEAAQ